MGSVIAFMLGLFLGGTVGFVTAAVLSVNERE